MVNTTGAPFFAQIALLFTCKVPNIETPYDLALVRPMRQYRYSLKRDRELGFLHLEADTMPTEFIHIRSIIRGAHLVPDWSETLPARSWLVTDVIDDDMFLRICRDFPGRTAGVEMVYPEDNEYSGSDKAEDEEEEAEEETYLDLFSDDSGPDNE